MRPSKLLTSLALLTIGVPAALADGPGAAPQGPTPTGDLYIPQARVAYDAPGDGLLWARGTTYKASFGPEGASYIPFLGADAPRNMPVRMRLATARVGDRQLPLTDRASWSREADSVTLERGAVDVRYHLGLDSVEQTFVVDELVPDGDLVVEIDLESELELREHGPGFEFAGELGGVRYGSATVLDADGRSLALETRRAGGGLEIRVPRTWLETARQPVVIDPIITTYGVNVGPTGTWGDSLSYDATHGMFLHAFTVLFSQQDYDIYSVPVEWNGTVRHDLGLWVDVSDTKWLSPSVANSNADDNFLIVAEADDGPETRVYGRIRQLPGLQMGPVLSISNSWAPECRLPSVGGDMTEGGSSNYCVSWVEQTGQMERKVRYRILDSTGSMVTGVRPLDAAENLSVWRPQVSDSNGVGLSGERCWNIVWMSTATEYGESDIRGAQVRPNGDLLTAPFTVDSRSINHGYPDVCSPMLAPSGGPRDFIAVYTASVDGQSDLHGRLFKGNDYIASYDLGAIEAQVIGESFLGRGQNWPAVSTDGSSILVAYNELEGQDMGVDMYLSTFHHNGWELFPLEVHQLVASHPSEHQSMPQVASVHDSGVVGAPLSAMTWTAGVGGGDANTMGALYLRPAGWNPLGTVTCSGMPNSTGHAATFRAYGSSDVTDNRLFLDADNLPHFQFGQFLMSSNHGVTPFGNGFLCLAAPHVRLTSTQENSWVQGAVGHQLDLSNLPQGLQFQPGETWYFQYWYRDNGSFNFSNALELQFE